MKGTVLSAFVFWLDSKTMIDKLPYNIWQVPQNQILYTIHVKFTVLYSNYITIIPV